MGMLEKRVGELFTSSSRTPTPRGLFFFLQNLSRQPHACGRAQSRWGSLKDRWPSTGETETILKTRSKRSTRPCVSLSADDSDGLVKMWLNIIWPPQEPVFRKRRRSQFHVRRRAHSRQDVEKPQPSNLEGPLLVSSGSSPDRAPLSVGDQSNMM